MPVSTRRGAIAAGGMSSVNAYVAAVLADSPAGYWQLNEGSGSTAVDSSGHSLNGSYINSPTLSGAGPMTGETSMTASVTGTKYASVADNNLLDLGDTWTLECWLFRTGTAASQYIITKGANAYGLLVTAGGGNQLTAQKLDSTNLRVSLTGYPGDSTWHYVVAVKNGGSGTELYRDASAAGTGGTNATCADTAVSLKIGAYPSTGFEFEGRMAHVAVYPTALSTTRISAHYAARF